MKIKVTKKAILENYKTVISAGYCECDYLLKNTAPTYYTTGVYGWNSDVYILDYDTVIVTGYRPFGNIKPDYDMVKTYDDRARQVLSSNIPREQANEQIYSLLCEFIHECKKGSK